MAGEDDAEEVVDLALLVVGRGPLVRDGRDLGQRVVSGSSSAARTRMRSTRAMLRSS